MKSKIAHHKAFGIVILLILLCSIFVGSVQRTKAIMLPEPNSHLNAIWINTGTPTATDLAFFESHGIYTIYWEAALYGTAGLNSTNSDPIDGGTSICIAPDINCSSISQIASVVSSIHSYNSQFKVILWLACWNAYGYGYPDYSTQTNCSTLCANEANFVSQCGFDGVASDLESDWWSYQLMINYYNTEAQYIHALGGGKITVPFMDLGAYRSPSACLSYIQTYLTQLTGPDYLQSSFDTTSEQNYDGGAVVGFIPNLNYLLTYLSKPLVIAIGYEKMSIYVQYLNDYFAEYGVPTASQIAGYSIYDYAAGLSGTPPSNQVYPSPDAPITASDWSTWDSFCPSLIPSTSIDLSPNSGTARISVTISGAGFAGFSALTAAFNGTTVWAGTSTSNGTVPSGATFNIPTVSPSSYTVTVTDASSNSASAILNVTQYSPIDFYHEGKVDSLDFFYFMNAYIQYVTNGVYNPACDLNHDGKIDIEDFLLFVNYYIQYTAISSN